MIAPSCSRIEGGGNFRTLPCGVAGRAIVLPDAAAVLATEGDWPAVGAVAPELAPGAALEEAAFATPFATTNDAVLPEVALEIGGAVDELAEDVAEELELELDEEAAAGPERESFDSFLSPPIDFERLPLVVGLVGEDECSEKAGRSMSDGGGGNLGGFGEDATLYIIDAARHMGDMPCKSGKLGSALPFSISNLMASTLPFSTAMRKAVCSLSS